jgi:copper homeostasis protein
MNNIKLEICVYNIPSILAALEGGANRVELCASMPEGGITPSKAMIEMAQKVAMDNEFKRTLGVMVMIRPRGGDFLYDKWEFEQMLKDIELCKEIGVRGVVFGILTKDGDVDIDRNKILLQAAQGMQTCFHRAIDMSRDYVKAAEDIARLGFTRILTSGANNNATDGIANIEKIVSLFGKDIEIMAGSGVKPNNIAQIYDRAKVKAFHFSAKKIIPGQMLYKNPNVSMGGFGDISEYDLVLSDKDEITKAVEVIKSL